MYGFPPDMRTSPYIFGAQDVHIRGISLSIVCSVLWTTNNPWHESIRLMQQCKQVWYFIPKNQPGLRCSNPFKSSPGSHSLLVSDSVGMARFWHIRSRSASHHCIYVRLPLLLSIYLKLITVLDYSYSTCIYTKQLSKLPKSTKVR